MFQLKVEPGNSVKCYGRASFAGFGVHDPRLNLKKNFMTMSKYILINDKTVPQEQFAAKK